MRKFISIIFGVLLIVGAVYVSKMLTSNKESKKPKAKILRKIVSTQIVKNKTIPIQITTSGTIQAKQKIDLSSEVQGILKQGTKDFKAGTYFNKGESILRINSEEHLANLRSQKSNFYSILTAVMPDLQLDFPEAYPKWLAYLNAFDMQKPLAKLPETTSEKEKYFITGRNILSSYYNVKNVEVRLEKYTIRAPFSGVLADATVNPGALISPGQRLGEFINTSVYELEVSVNTMYGDLLQKGKKVMLHNLDQSKNWTGVVSRINPKVDRATQTIKVYIELRDKNLKEGMYLEANLTGKTIDNAFEVARKLLVDDTKIYVIKDTILSLVTVTPVFFNEKTVVVKGLENNEKILKEPVPGSYEGMVVKLNSKSDSQKVTGQTSN